MGWRASTGHWRSPNGSGALASAVPDTRPCSVSTPHNVGSAPPSLMVWALVRTRRCGHSRHGTSSVRWHNTPRVGPAVELLVVPRERGGDVLRGTRGLGGLAKSIGLGSTPSPPASTAFLVGVTGWLLLSLWLVPPLSSGFPPSLGLAFCSGLRSLDFFPFGPFRLRPRLLSLALLFLLVGAQGPSMGFRCSRLNFCDDALGVGSSALPFVPTGER